MELRIPGQTEGQIERLRIVTEEAAKKYLCSGALERDLETLDVGVEVDGSKPMNLLVAVDVDLSPRMKVFNVQKTVDEAVKHDVEATAERLRGVSCHLQK